MEGTLYRHLLRDSWRITWKNPLLWVLGALSVFWGGVGAYSSIDSIFGRMSRVPEGALGGSLPALQDFSLGGLIMVAITACIVLALLSGFIALVTAARGGLIYSIQQRFEKKPITLRAALKKGFKKFWPILGIVL